MLSKTLKVLILCVIVSCTVYQTQHLCIFKTKVVDSLFSATVGTHVRVIGVLYIFMS
ncbi:hypothetical protein HanIR_Chr11g0527681 [Helianthus annuus]|nr:hypothetical protein HanIR_Chr11g0527681 [Helianthus annuus]